MGGWKSLFAILFCSLTWTFSSLAQEVHPFYEGARALGMGGAQIAVVDDETSVLVNPAGLGKLRDFYGTIADPEVTFNSNDGGIYTNSSFTSPFDPSQVSTALQKSPTQDFYAKFQMFPSIVFKNFGFGLYYRQEIDMTMNSALNAVNTYFLQDEGLFLAYNLRIWEGRIKIGVTGKAIDRVEVNNTALAFPGNYSLNNIGSEGLGIGGDVGLNLAAPWVWLPTLSIVARNVGGTNFTSDKNLQISSTTTPPGMTQDYDVALAVFPILGNYTHSSLTAEVQQVLASQTAADPTRYYHVGYEIDFYDAVFLRVGLNGHGPTAGLEIANTFMQFQAATYGEDIGQGTNISVDQRYVIKFAFRF